MKKFILMIICVMSCISMTAQQKYINSNNIFAEGTFGINIPTDGTSTFCGFGFEFGKYINPVFGIGMNLAVSECNDEYSDDLGIFGINTHYRLTPYFVPESNFDFELFAGLNYGWLTYYDYYLYDNETISYVVPKVGANIFLNLDMGHTMQLGLEPSFSWYISTNKEESNSVGVFNILAKFRINF